jgi:hypothetical protein
MSGQTASNPGDMTPTMMPAGGKEIKTSPGQIKPNFQRNPPSAVLFDEAARFTISPRQTRISGTLNFAEHLHVETNWSFGAGDRFDGRRRCLGR